MAAAISKASVCPLSKTAPLPAVCRLHRMPASCSENRRHGFMPWKSSYVSCKGVSNGKPVGQKGRNDGSEDSWLDGDFQRTGTSPGRIGMQSPAPGDSSQFLSAGREGAKQGKQGSSRPRKGLEGGNEGEDPYREFEGGGKVYLDELDILDLLDPHPFLRPIDSSTYNHAAFLWKKIGDIPEERRHRLIDLLEPKHIDKMWEIAGLRYEFEDLFVEDPLAMFPRTEVADPCKPVYWEGRVNGVPWAIGWCSRFQNVFFVGKDGKLYGRVIVGGPVLQGVVSKISPLYFEVKRASRVVATDEPCDLTFEYGSGQLHLKGTLPHGFPAPAKHLGPFGDAYFDYMRSVGPGFFVGQAWQEGLDLQQPPQAKLGRFVLARKFSEQ